MCHAAVVSDSMAQETRATTTAIIIVILRPAVSTKTPPRNGPNMEPILMREPIHEACDVSMGRKESSAVSFVRAGEVQLNKLPSENAPMLAEN